MKVTLKLSTNKIVSEIVLKERESVIIGRTSRSNHMIPDELLSSAHCKILLMPNKLEVIDLESKNGTYLNGLRIEQSDLFLGDEIRIGNTKVIISTEKMDTESVETLTFPGASKDRQSHGLQLDFTGARMINQGLVPPLIIESRPTTSANRELEVRKKVHSKIRLSKQEIKLRNKSRSSLASTFDVFFIFSAIALPLVMVNVLILTNPTLFQSDRLVIMVTSVVASLSIFFGVNFKILKFTIGEKISGIEKLYNEQEL
jgi:hypothetical protein